MAKIFAGAGGLGVLIDVLVDSVDISNVTEPLRKKAVELNMNYFS